VLSIAGVYTDPTSLRAVVTLTDGSTLVTETAESVAKRAVQARSLCLGGMSGKKTSPMLSFVI
jgi:hypothetical protein